MSIQVTCPSCRNTMLVDDHLAGRDVVCPQCDRRLTAPSFSAERPDLGPGVGPALPPYRAGEWDEPQRGRWGDDEDFQDRRPQGTWSVTLAGLSVMFWAILSLAVVSEIASILNIVVGQNPGLFMNAGNPRGDEMALAGGLMVVGCAILGLAITGFVGMCMCCTVPQESGAKGKAIASVILVVLFVVAVIIAVIVFFAWMMNLAAGGGPPPAQFPISFNTLIVVTVAAGMGQLLIVGAWLLFHKAIADHFHNSSLSRNAVWFIVGFAVNLMGNIVLQSMLMRDLLAPDQKLMVAGILWSMAWTLALSIWYLYIVAQTRRTIIDGQRTW